jgi:hypothetical protein
MTVMDSPIANRQSQIANLLTRPDEQRLREFKYRFSQSVVFGLPVIALQFFGPLLGPADSDRWVSLLQALLAGWVLYVNLGMFFEGVLLLPGRISIDLPVAAIAIALYLYSAVSAIAGIATGHLWYRPLLFHMCVAVLMLWSAVRWATMARRGGGSATAPVTFPHDARDRSYQPPRGHEGG